MYFSRQVSCWGGEAHLREGHVVLIGGAQKGQAGAVADERVKHAGGLAGQRLLEPAQLREAGARGVELGGHGVRHCDLTRLAPQNLRTELRDGRARLTDWAEREVRYLAYPFGAFDRRIMAATGDEYAAAFTTQLSAVPRSPHLHAIPRIDAYYLDQAGLLDTLQRGAANRRLALRRWLRRIRGTEPRRPIPAARTASPTGEGAWAWR